MIEVIPLVLGMHFGSKPRLVLLKSGMLESLGKSEDEAGRDISSSRHRAELAYTINIGLLLARLASYHRLSRTLDETGARWDRVVVLIHKSRPAIYCPLAAWGLVETSLPSQCLDNAKMGIVSTRALSALSSASPSYSGTQVETFHRHYSNVILPLEQQSPSSCFALCKPNAPSRERPAPYFLSPELLATLEPPAN